MKKNQIILRFSIHNFDDISHDEITHLLDIKPSHLRIKGQKKNPKNSESSLIESNSWSMDSGLDKYADFDEQMSSLLDILESKKDILKPICEKYRCEISCGMYVYFGNDESTPWVHMDARYNKLTRELNIEFDLDLYVLPNQKKSTVLLLHN